MYSNGNGGIRLLPVCLSPYLAKIKGKKKDVKAIAPKMGAAFGRYLCRAVLRTRRKLSSHTDLDFEGVLRL